MCYILQIKTCQLQRNFLYYYQEDKYMKISFKLTLFMVILSLISTGTVGVALLLQARGDIISLAHDKAITTAQDYGGEVRSFLSSYWFTAETLASFMEAYENIAVLNRRPLINSIIKSEIEKYADITGIWVIWEPDVLEGDDSQFIGVPGSTEFGRFTPYWHREDGDIMMYSLPEKEFLDPVEGSYYRIPKEKKRTTLLDPYFDDVNGTLMLNTSIATPILSTKDRNKVLGVVGIDINVDSIQTLSDGHIPFGSGFTAIFSKEGTVVAHFDHERVGKSMKETERDMAGNYFNEFINAVSNGNLFYFTNYISDVGADYSIYVSPINIGQYDDTWSYAIAVPLKTIMEGVNQMLWMIIIITFTALIFIFFAAIFLSRSLSRPILKVTETLKDISEGEGDLTRNININSKDEIGDLSHYFNMTIEKIKNLVIKIKSETIELSDIGNTLSSNMTETASAMNEITANIQSIKGRVINQSASVSETHATMEQVTGNIHTLNEHVEDQSSHISQASASIEEMVANINSVTETLIKNSSNVKSLKDASKNGRNGLQEVATDIQEIERESEGLLEINSVMENISSQTNLLSMNAAIEAAHAGEAGKGFAVVAEEIRKLAESSSEQSKTIGVVLKKIKESIDKITNSTKNVLNKFEAIDSNVNIVTEQIDSIRIAMEEQGEGSKHLLEGMNNVNGISLQVKNGSAEMLEGSIEIIKESNNLEKVTQEITSGMNEMAIGADQVNSAVSNVNEISIKNREGINVLIKEVSRFKVD